jgi:hypothetical protein
MDYKFKKLEELGWAAAIGAGIFGLQVLADFDPSTVTDWKTYAIASGAGALRAAGAAALVLIHTWRSR